MSTGAAGSVAFPLSCPARLLEGLGDAFVATDREFRITIWNAAAEQLFGYTAEEAVGRSAWALMIYGVDLSPATLDEELDRAGIARTVSRARRKDGAFIDVEVVPTAMRDITDA